MCIHFTYKYIYIYHTCWWISVSFMTEQSGPVSFWRRINEGVYECIDCFGELSFAETRWVGPATNCHSTQSLEAFWSVARYFRCTLGALLVKRIPVCGKLLGRMQPRRCEKMQMEKRYDCAVLARDVLASQSRKPIAAIMLEHWINVHQLVKVSDPYLPKQTCSPKML